MHHTKDCINIADFAQRVCMRTGPVDAVDHAAMKPLTPSLCLGVLDTIKPAPSGVGFPERHFCVDAVESRFEAARLSSLFTIPCWGIQTISINSSHEQFNPPGPLCPWACGLFFMEAT